MKDPSIFSEVINNAKKESLFIHGKHRGRAPYIKKKVILNECLIHNLKEENADDGFCLVDRMIKLRSFFIRWLANDVSGGLGEP
jgi:hypothetical protein